MAQQVILTLFGEEIIPEPVKPEKKTRAPKKKEEAEYPPVTKTEQPEEKVAKEKKTRAKKVEAASAVIVSSDELLKNFEGEKQYYSIGEVSKLFKVNTSHIRFWTNEFKMKVRTTRKGDRLYTAEQIKELQAIYHLVKERGFTIKGAKAKLKEKKKTTIESVDLKQSLLDLRKKLVQIKNEIKQEER
jgi:DNA-binding transcriptional MerR regulator